MYENAAGFDRRLPLTLEMARSIVQMDDDARQQFGAWPPTHCDSETWFMVVDAARKVLKLPDLTQERPLPPSGLVVFAEMRRGSTCLMRCEYVSDPETGDPKDVQWLDFYDTVLSVSSNNVMSWRPDTEAHLRDAADGGSGDY